MPRKALMHHDKTNETGLMMRFDTLPFPEKATGYRAPGMALGSVNARTTPHNHGAGDAQSCQNLPNPKSQKPAIKRAPEHFLLDRAGQRRTSNHSHSIVAGGLLDTS